MPLPRAVAVFNRRYTNWLLEPLARRHQGFAIIHHRGRKTGVARRTPVNTFSRGDTLVIALTYGRSADWFQNLQANGGCLERQHRLQTIVSATAVDRDEVHGTLPLISTLALDVLGVDEVCQLTLASD